MATQEPVRRARVFHTTDYGNAERLVAAHGSDLHYVHPWRRWYVWDGRRWAPDATAEVHRRAKAVARAIYHEAAEAEDREERDHLGKWAARSEESSRINAMITMAASEPGVPLLPDAFDTDPYLLTVLNGTIDLRTATIRAHGRDDLITKLVPAEYDPAAECPRWLAFLERILGGDEEMVGFLQRAVGYSLTGATSEQCLFFLYGEGANGKSTFLEMLRLLGGEYAMQADFTTFLDGPRADGPRNDIARMFGARLVTSSEVGEGKRLNESLVKSLTGGDTVAARFLYAEAFEFRPAFKLWLAANHRPVIRGTDDAIWRRIRLIPFTVQIPEGERDPFLVRQLTAELSGILAWAVEGCQRWLENGLRPPAGVIQATTEYRQESDALGAFLEENCVIGVGEFVKASELYQAYVKWAEAQGHGRMSSTAFGRRLTDRGFPAEKRGSGSARVIYRVGLDLIASATIGSQRPFWDSSSV